MADEADRAGNFIEQAYEKGVAAIRANLGAGISAAECADCGEPIPEARRRAVSGCTTCVECQQERERSAA